MDQVVIHRIAAILSEMGLQQPISFLEDFDPAYCIRDFGEHRLFEFHLEVRDDVDPDDFITDFRTAMQRYNEASKVKTDFYGIEEYPGPVKNWHTAYLTVTTV